MWPYDPDEFESATREPEGAASDDALCFLSIDGRFAAAHEQGELRPLRRGELRWLQVEIHDEHYLGRFRGVHCYAASGSGSLPQGYLLDGLRGWLGRIEPTVFYLAGRAQQVLDFHATHRFCGRCGQATGEHPEERARVCPSCGHTSYPRLSPSIIVLVTRGREMLLARNANWPSGMYSTLAGFVEPGESIEQTVHREVLEEVGIRLGKLHYKGSQSWPFPNSLMLGFHADYVSGDIVCRPGEISDARWFTRDTLPKIPMKTAISRWLIDDFVEKTRGYDPRSREGQGP